MSRYYADFKRDGVRYLVVQVQERNLTTGFPITYFRIKESKPGAEFRDYPLALARSAFPMLDYVKWFNREAFSLHLRRMRGEH